MPGVRQKPIERLAYKRGGRGNVSVLPPPPAVIPTPPADLGEYAVAAWNAFWCSPTSGTVKPSEMIELHNWARCVHARDELWRQVGIEPTGVGSMGQEVANWRWGEIARLSVKIDRHSAKFGMTPLDRMRLTGQLDQAEAAESNIKARRDGRRPTLLPVKKRT